MSRAEGVDMEALKAALMKVEGNRPDNLGISTQWHRNPEGPEAWAVIEALQAERDDWRATATGFAARIAQLETALAGAREALEAANHENGSLRAIVQGWHYLAVGPDEMGDYYTHKQLVKASEPYALPALRTLAGDPE